MRFAKAKNVTWSALLLALLWAAPQVLHGQGAAFSAPAAAQAPAVQPRKTSPPFTGDPSQFETKDRDKKLQIDRVMAILGVKPGATVADIGAGSGWFTVRAATRVGVRGKVYAVEINPSFVQHIRERAQREGFGNIETILGHDDDPLLPANSIDSVLLLKTYHEVAQPVPLLKNLRKALKPGARVGIIDRHGKGDDHGIDADIVIKEAGEAGYELIGQHDFVKGDEGVNYFLVFRSR